MKNLILATLLTLGTLSSALALDLGIRTTRAYGTQEANGFGITMGQKFGKVGLQGSFDRTTGFTTGSQDRYAVEGSYDITKISGATVAGVVGAGYLDNRLVEGGVVGTVGAKVSYPLTKTISVVGDYRYQRGDSRVTTFDGNQFAIGVSYAF